MYVCVCVCSPPAQTVSPSGWPQPIDSRAGNPPLFAVAGVEMDPRQSCYRWAYSHIRSPRTTTRCPCPSWVDLHSRKKKGFTYSISHLFIWVADPNHLPYSGCQHPNRSISKTHSNRSIWSSIANTDRKYSKIWVIYIVLSQSYI